MYERFFKLNSKPFALNPDPKFLFRSRQHGAALTMLEYAIESQAGFCLLTGEIGSGKTTVVRQMIRTLDAKFTIGMVSNAHERFQSILPWILSTFDVAPSDDSDIALYEALTDFIIREYGKGRRTLLIIDEAQNLPVCVLEELRVLSNINSEGDVALQVLLVGQPELCDTLEKPEMKQFAQRVAVHFHLDRLGPGETWAYIRHRLLAAGGNPGLFTAEAIAFIHGRAGGIPRLVNQLCDLALVYAFADQRSLVDESLVREAFRERQAGRTIRVFNPEPAAGAPPIPQAVPAAAGATALTRNRV
jgi:type II secretory pathway predicted ATPase ExeA